MNDTIKAYSVYDVETQNVYVIAELPEGFYKKGQKLALELVEANNNPYLGMVVNLIKERNETKE